MLSLAWPYYGVQGDPLPWPDTAYFIGGVALLLSTVIRQPLWWRLIHAVFVPLVWQVGTLGIDPLWFLLAFVLLLLFFRSAPGSQIPLYFSNETTATAVAELTATATASEMRFIDLGAGIGSLARPLAAARPDARIVGVENSPAAWLIGFVAARGMRNLHWQWGNLWQTGLGEYNVAYAFLSPAPMAALWIKVKREMRPGSLFVSNSFPGARRAAERSFRGRRRAPHAPVLLPDLVPEPLRGAGSRHIDASARRGCPAGRRRPSPVSRLETPSARKIAVI